MLGKRKPDHALFQMVTIDELVPKEHFLRKLHAAVDFSFVRDVVRPLYCEDNGRPSVDPELVLRMYVLAYLYELSENRLVDEISMHAGYRWFCGLDFHDPIPDRTTLVKLRRERWGPNGVFEELLYRVVAQGVAAGLISADVLATDGTVVKARASMKSLQPIVSPIPLAEFCAYLEDEAAKVQNDDDDQPSDDPPPSTGRIRKDGGLRGKKFSNATHRSTTDPDARIYRKSPRVGAELSYMVHYTIDPRSGFILATKASQATGYAEMDAALEMVPRVRRAGVDPKYMLLDGGYGPGHFVADLMEMGIQPLIPLWGPVKPLSTKPYRPRTLSAARKHKKKLRERKALYTTRLLYRSAVYRRTYPLRQRIEHAFAEAKEHHGLGRARGYGLMAMNIQAQMTALVQNLKRMVRLTGRRGRAPSQTAAMEAPITPNSVANTLSSHKTKASKSLFYRLPQIFSPA